ncbi:MAG: CDP-diacylglycerol--glycerol-3-phosphate 3-phosphatidyltransferase [Clostridia bacterium]|nr:CDP-diacylglycerol--glycerol-3-phosphate 3-phosphatidyltransferase [Clostridia bacterium]
MKMKLNLATKITIARILFIVPTIAAFIVGQLFAHFGNELGYFIGNVVAAALFAICCSTDFVDGYIARKTGTVTDLGKLLDPLADKVVIVIMLFLVVLFRDGLDRVFAYNTLVIAVLSGIILSRELLISVFRSIAASKNCVLAADIFGKIKTVVLDVAVTTLMLAGMHVVIGYMGTVLFYLGAALTVYSGVNYIVKNRHVFVENSESKEQESSVAMNEPQYEEFEEYQEGLSQEMCDEFENREENRELLDKLQMAKQSWEDKKIEEENLNRYMNRQVNFEEVHGEEFTVVDTNDYNAPAYDLFGRQTDGYVQNGQNMNSPLETEMSYDEAQYGNVQCDGEQYSDDTQNGDSAQYGGEQYGESVQYDGGMQFESNAQYEEAVQYESDVQTLYNRNVKIGELLVDKEFLDSEDNAMFVVGRDENGMNCFASFKELSSILLVGGANSGKSNFIRTMISSLLYKATPDDLKFILIDSEKFGESVYDRMPHLLVDEVISDIGKAERAIAWATKEAMLRMKYLQDLKYRSIDRYNDEIAVHGKKKMPRIVVVIDNFDYIATKMNRNIVNGLSTILRFARCSGVNLVLSVKRIAPNILSMSDRGNIQAFAVFKVYSAHESQIALGSTGAEKLTEKGEMLFRINNDTPRRIRGALTTQREVEDIVEYVKAHNVCNFDGDINDVISYGDLYASSMVETENENANSASANVQSDGSSDNSANYDNNNSFSQNDSSAESDKEFEKDKLMYETLKALVALGRERGYVSIAGLQRKLGVGFPKAAALWTELENRGVIKEDENHTFIIAQDLDKLEKLLQELAPVYEDGAPNGDVE